MQAQGDIIAYLGQVPVRVHGHVASGDTLVPSTRHDGTAVAVRRRDNQSSHSEGQSREISGAVVGIAMSTHVPSAAAGQSRESDSDVGGMVDALKVLPRAGLRHSQTDRQRELRPTDKYVCIVSIGG